MTRHVRQAAETDPRWGCRPEERDLRAHVEWGVVLLDKPAGPTSHAAAESVRRLAGASRAGHGGTLDPAVTGVLPVLLGHSTRLASIMLGSDKAYAGVMLLHADVGEEELEPALAQFRGPVVQMPPRRSRVRRRPRERTVHGLEVTERDGRAVRFSVQCEGGTYVRKLVHDLGQALGCGAHMTELRRVRSGPFGVEECATMAEAEAAAEALARGDERPMRSLVRPAEEAASRLVPRVWVDDGAVASLCRGAELAAPGVCALEDFEAGARVAVVTLKDELIGLGEALIGSEEALGAAHGLAVRMRQVLMAPGVYPNLFRGNQ